MNFRLLPVSVGGNTNPDPNYPKPAAPAAPPPVHRPVFTLGHSMAVCIAGDKVRVDIAGELHAGRVSTLLEPAEAMRLATELSALVRVLGPKG